MAKTGQDTVLKSGTGDGMTKWDWRRYKYRSTVKKSGTSDTVC